MASQGTDGSNAISEPAGAPSLFVAGFSVAGLLWEFLFRGLGGLWHEKTSPQTERVELVSLHDIICENAVRCPAVRHYSRYLRLFRINASCRLPQIIFIYALLL